MQILELRPSTSALEAAAHEELEMLLGKLMHFTPEKCLADWAYGTDPKRLLGSQTKSCTMQPNTGKMKKMYIVLRKFVFSQYVRIINVDGSYVL